MKTWQKIKEHPELLDQYLIRGKVIDGIREFFKAREFHEVETPLLVRSPGTEPYLEVFETAIHFAEGDHERAFLLTSPEYSMKKLLVAGMKNIFQISKSFRNGEGRSSKHNHEFTILEYYRTDADYTKLMTDLEELFLFLIQKIKASSETKMSYQKNLLDFSTPWPRMSVSEAFQQWVGVSSDQLLDRNALAEAAEKRGYQVTTETTWEEIYNQLFLNEIEPKFPIDRPLFLYDYPITQAALSRPKKDDPRFAERFELYIAGVEIGNAFSELNDPNEQERRLRAEVEERKKLGKVEYGIDEDFIQALHAGMPDSAGIAIGVDRVIMLLADTPSIHETMFFPISEIFE